MKNKSIEFILIGVALIILSGIIIYISLDTPKLQPEIETNTTIFLLETTQHTNNEVTIVNVNTASVNDLLQLPGIGETKAQAIVDYRQENGLFASTEELMEVNGIGEALFNKICPYVTV